MATLRQENKSLYWAWKAMKRYGFAPTRKGKARLGSDLLRIRNASIGNGMARLRIAAERYGNALNGKDWLRHG